MDEWHQIHKVECRRRSKQYYHLHKRAAQIRQRRYYHNLKTQVLKHYGGGKVQCALCQESDIRCLSIDHIDGNGCKHRRELKSKGGVHFYHWLRTNRYPEGYRVLCMNCQFKSQPNNYMEVENGNSKY